MNVIWHENKVSKNIRTENLQQTGLVLWFTGLSGSGKSTIAAEVEAELAQIGFTVYLLDGDNLRHGMSSNLGFSNSDRDENIRRIYETAALFCDLQIITLVSAISPFKKARLSARKKIEEINKINSQNSGAFCEIYVKAGIETCKSRDPKGLYEKAIKGEIDEFTGINSPYEEPENPEIIIDTEKISVGGAVKIILQYVFEKQMNYLLPKILVTAVYAAYDAGKIILDIYAKDFSNSIEYKDDKSPLTEADKKSNALICGRLRKYAPYIDILAEESINSSEFDSSEFDSGGFDEDKERLENKFCFIVDPLDGTKEFIKKNGEFTVNIGLSYNNRPVMGVVYVPCQKKFYYAIKDRGAYAIDLNKDIIRFSDLFDSGLKIKVSGRTNGLTVMKSRSHGDEKLDVLLEKNKHRIKNQIEAGSSLKGCLIAEGIADVYYRFGYTMEWDTCAMQCIVEEAGGIFAQGDWSEMTYNRDDSLNKKGFVILNRAENRFD